MTIEAKIIAKLEQETVQCALEGLRKPADQSSYEFGRLVGFVSGLDRAKAIVDKLLEEQDEPKQRSAPVNSYQI